MANTDVKVDLGFTELLIDKILSTDEFDFETIEATKVNIADTIVCGLLGKDAPGMPQLLKWIDSLGTTGKSNIWGHNKKVPPSIAALCNGAMAHALDFDDTHDDAVLHAGVGCIPAALATAENTPGTTGLDFIKATIWGVETSSLLGLATPEGPGQSGWMLTSLYSYFASAVSSAYILGLDKDQLNNALGLAFSMSAGNSLCVEYGALSKRLQPGFGSQSGVMATELALEGVTGPLNIFESKKGLFNIYHKISLQTNYGEDIGRPYQITQLSYKPYPCCRFNHAAIDAARNLHDRLKGLDFLNEVESIEVHVSDQANEAVCKPLERKQRPKTIVDAQFSIPFTVATALLNGNVTPNDFTEESCLNGKQLPLAEKVIPKIQSGHKERSIAGTTIKVKLTNGELFEEQVSKPSGQPGDFEELWNLVWEKLQLTDLKNKGEFFHTLRNLDELDEINTMLNYMN